MSFLVSPLAKIEAAQDASNYLYEQPDYVWEALQISGSSVAILNGRRLPEGNKPVAAIGDAAITLIIKDICYDKGSAIGAASQERDFFANNGRLARLGRSAGIDRMVNKNPSQPGPLSDRLMATTVEALVGAAFKDGGLEAARIVMVALGIIA